MTDPAQPIAAGNLPEFADASLAELAQQFGTPLYVYSSETLIRRYREFAAAFAPHPHRICYAVKANSNLAVLQVLASLGANFAVVSEGELERVLRAGGHPGQVVFSGVGKSHAEIERALLLSIGCFNVESEGELQRLAATAERLQRVAPVTLRVNPDIDAGTHPHIATGLDEHKFGVSMHQAQSLCLTAARSPWLELRGIACHIGSQLADMAPIIKALSSMLALVDELAAADITLQHLNLGGGLGVRYKDEQPLAVREYAGQILACLQHHPLHLLLEPGRWLVAAAGVLLTQVEYRKHNGANHFLVVDAAMNDLLRPALYEAWHDIVPVACAAPDAPGDPHPASVVGGICESTDVLGWQRRLHAQPGDLLAVRDAGAYGFVMASNYNSRNRPAEVMLHQGVAHLVRHRETIEDQLALERLIDL